MARADLREAAACVVFLVLYLAVVAPARPAERLLSGLDRGAYVALGVALVVFQAVVIDLGVDLLARALGGARP